MATEELKFHDVLHVGKAGVGVFKLTKEQLGWKRTDESSGEVVSFSGQDILEAEWQRGCGAGLGLLKLRFKGDSGVVRFSGLKVQDLAQVRTHLSKHFAVDIKQREVVTSGWSWGEWSCDDDGGEFRLCSSPDKNSSIRLEVPVAELTQVTTIGKQDLNLEFHSSQELDAGDEVLHEMRLFFPSLPGSSGVSAEQAKSELLQRANLSAAGQPIIRVPNIMVVAPRGKHGLEFFPGEIKLHGPSRTYILKSSNIQRLFLCKLPTNEAALVLALSIPVAPNQQPYLVLQMPEHERISIAHLTEDQRKRYQLPPQDEMMSVQTLVARLFKELSGKNVIAPATEFVEMLKQAAASSSSSSTEPTNCLKCSNKMNPAYIFPLKKSLICLPKPVAWISFKDVQCVTFVLGLQRGKTFDLKVFENNGQFHDFAQIDRSTLKPLYTFLGQTDVVINNGDEVANSINMAGRRSMKDDSSAPTAVSAVADEQGGEYNEEDDEDFDDDDGSSAGSDDDSSEEEEVKKKAPKAPRAKRARKT